MTGPTLEPVDVAVSVKVDRAPVTFEELAPGLVEGLEALAADYGLAGVVLAAAIMAERASS